MPSKHSVAVAKAEKESSKKIESVAAVATEIKERKKAVPTRRVNSVTAKFSKSDRSNLKGYHKKILASIQYPELKPDYKAVSDLNAKLSAELKGLDENKSEDKDTIKIINKKYRDLKNALPYAQQVRDLDITIRGSASDILNSLDLEFNRQLTTATTGALGHKKAKIIKPDTIEQILRTYPNPISDQLIAAGKIAVNKLITSRS
jgi:hypothetical protein